MVGALAGCGADGDSSSASSQSLPPSEPASSSAPEPTPEPTPQPPSENVPEAGENALTGLSAAEGMLEGQRPVAVIVMNSQRSLPQRGLAAADVLVEMLIDSQETRLLALYGDYRNVPQVGPVRSTYDQFVQFALPLDAIQVHIDKSQYAENLLAVLGQKDIDGIHLGKTAFWFDETRQLPRLTGKLNEYCWYTDAGYIWNGISSQEVYTVGSGPSLFQFAEAEDFAASEDAHYVQGIFSGLCTSGFNYNAEQGLYYKTNYGAAHTDDDGTQLAYNNVFFLNVDISQKEDSTLPEYDFTEGTGWYFTSGGFAAITWEKGDAQEAFTFKDESGAELQVKPGKSYIGFIPTGVENSVSWQSAQQLAEAA